VKEGSNLNAVVQLRKSVVQYKQAPSLLNIRFWEPYPTMSSRNTKSSRQVQQHRVTHTHISGSRTTQTTSEEDQYIDNSTNDFDDEGTQEDIFGGPVGAGRGGISLSHQDYLSQAVAYDHGSPYAARHASPYAAMAHEQQNGSNPVPPDNWKCVGSSHNSQAIPSQ
jgi:hypothetical protein